MTVMLLVSGVLTISYALLILAYMVGWSRQQYFTVPVEFVPETRINIVIAARNESANIESCLLSVLQQNYPASLFDITVVDDFSEDDTAEIVEKLSGNYLNLRLLQLKDFVADRSAIKSFKKKALETAIAHTTGELIITTDADCIASPGWISSIAAKYDHTKAQMIVAPVDFVTRNNLVEVFQSLDFMTMQGITGAAHKLRLGNMSNGANLAFTRTAFHAVEGYKGIDHLASGDDYLLMVKIMERFPGGIGYLKSIDAIICTTPQPDWASFLQQRIRWASKSGKYKDPKLTFMLLIVYLFNVSLIALFISSLVSPVLFKFFIASFATKIVLEMIFLWRVSAFFNKRRQLIIFPLLQPLHIIYISLAGFLGWKGKFVWKGRSVK